MSSYKQVLVLSVVVKTAVFVAFPNFHTFLDGSAEYSTPISSWRSLQEGIFLWNHNVNPYAGGVVYHPPLVVLALSWLRSLVSSETAWKYVLDLLFVAIDGAISLELLAVADKFLKSHKSTSESRNRLLRLLALFYSFNPVIFFSVFLKSSLIINSFFIALAVFSAVILDSLVLASISLAVSAYLYYTNVFLLVPFIGFAINFNKYAKQGLATALAAYVVTVAGLIYLSYWVNHNNWNFLWATYGTTVFFTKIRPNIGLWWYFFIEIFDFFSKFFIGVFNIYHVVYILPITIRFHNSQHSTLEVNNKYKFFPLILCYGFLILTKAYPTLTDLGFFSQLLLLLVFQNNLTILPFLRYPLVLVLLIAHAIILSPIFYYLWIFSGSGNSNFFYAINLVYGLGLGSILIDFTWSYLSMEYIFAKNGHKEITGEEKVRLTQI